MQESVSCPGSFAKEVATKQDRANDSNRYTRNFHYQIYCINLDSSKDRMDAMVKMFNSLRLTKIHRVAASDADEAAKAWKSKELVFHPLIKLVPRTDESPSWRDHWNYRYYYEEAACLLSHLKAIKQAYEDGQEHAFILEDDAKLSMEFLDMLPAYLERAPLGWKVLQLATNQVRFVL